MNSYLLGSASLFFLLAIIWDRKDWGNAFIKVVFFVMAGFGFFFTSVAAGYFVHLPK